MKSSINRSTTFTFAVLSLGLSAVIGSAAEKLPPLRDRFGDPLPPGAVRRFGTLRFRHSGISDLAFTPDGKYLISGGRSNPLLVYDAATGRKLREIGNDRPQSQTLMEFALSPDGKRVAGCGSDVFVWELATGRLIRQFNFKDRYGEVTFSPDGTKIAALKEEHRGGAGTLIRIVIGDIASGRQVQDWFVHEGKQLSVSFDGLQFSSDGKYLAGRFSEMHEEKPFVHLAVSSRVWLLDAATGKRVRIIGSPRGLVACFGFQPGSGRLAGYGTDGILRFWDAASGKEIQHFQIAEVKEENGYGELRFSSDGNRCAVLTNRAKYVTVLDTKDGRVLRRIEGKESRLKVALALSGDGKTVASARVYDETCVRLWDIASGAERLADAGHRAAPTALSLSANGRTLISQDDTGRRIYWDLQTGKSDIRSFDPREAIGKFDWSPDLSQKTLRGPHWRMVYKNQRPAEIEVRSLDGAKLIGKLEKRFQQIPMVALSPDGTQLAIAPWASGSNTLLLWNPEREEKPRRLPGNSTGYLQVIFSHDGKRLIGGGGARWGNPQLSKGWLSIWDVASARILHELHTGGPPGRLLLTSDDRVLLVSDWGSDAAVHAWDMDTGTKLARLVDPLMKPPNDNTNWRTQPAITGLAVSADGRFLAVVTSWGDVSSLRVWETGSWKLLHAFPLVSPRNNVRAMVFSRDGRSAFTANEDSTILEWDVSANGRSQLASKTLNKDRLNLLWLQLTATPNNAYPAVWEMLNHPAQAVPFLVEKLPPSKPDDEKQITRLLAQLDADSFAEREQATRQLIALGEPFSPKLRQTLKDHPTLETKRRLERILEALSNGPSREQLRIRRALAVLEWSDSAAAGEHLRRLAEGAPFAARTREAKAAWQRRKG